MSRNIMEYRRPFMRKLGQLISVTVIGAAVIIAFAGGAHASHSVSQPCRQAQNRVGATENAQGLEASSKTVRSEIQSALDKSEKISFDSENTIRQRESLGRFVDGTSTRNYAQSSDYYMLTLKLESVRRSIEFCKMKIEEARREDDLLKLQMWQRSLERWYMIEAQILEQMDALRMRYIR